MTPSKKRPHDRQNEKQRRPSNNKVDWAIDDFDFHVKMPNVALERLAQVT